MPHFHKHSCPTSKYSLKLWSLRCEIGASPLSLKIDKTSNPVLIVHRLTFGKL